jgi:hypothetical protein
MPSTTQDHTESQELVFPAVGVERSEPGGRAQRNVGSSTSRYRTPSRNGPKPATGQSRYLRSRSTSVITSPTLQTDRHWLTTNGVTVTLNQETRLHS